MPAPIKVQFAIAGEREVLAAFDNIAKRSERLNRTQARGANDNAKAFRASAAEQEKAAQRAEKARERAAMSAEKSAQRAAKAAERAAQQEARAVERAEQQKTRAVEKEAKERARIVARETKKQERELGKTSGGIAGGISRAGRSTMGTVTGIAGGLGFTGGIAMVGSAIAANLELQRQAALLVNATRDKGGRATQSVGGLMGQAQGMAGKYGIGADEILSGLGVVAARAGGEKGLTAMSKDLEDLTKTAVASGTSMEDMGAVYAAAFNAGVKPGEEMRQLIQDLVAMGKEGAVEFKDLASELGRLGGAGMKTELGAGAMIRRQVGLAQIAVEAAVSPEESRTAVKDTLSDLGTHAATLKKSGINVFNAKGQMADPSEIIASVIDSAFTKGIGGKHGGTKKGAEALYGAGALFTGTSQNLITTLAKSYQEGYDDPRTGKRLTGRDAVVARINAASTSSLAPGERDKGVATMLETPAMKMKIATEQFHAKIGELLPRITELVPKLLALSEAFAKMVTWAAENPFKAIGALFTANLTKEIAEAGIGAAVKGGIESTFAGMQGQKLTFTGNLQAAGSIAMTAAAVYLVGREIIDQAQASGERRGKARFATDIEATNLVSAVNSQGGVATPEQAAQAKKYMADLAPKDKGRSPWEYALAATMVSPVGFLANVGYHGYKTLAGSAEKSSSGHGAGSKEAEAQAARLNAALARIAAAADGAARNLDKVANADQSDPNHRSRGPKPASR